MDLEISKSDAKKITGIHEQFKNYMTKPNVINTLEDNILKIKIPFLRNRVICKIKSDKIIQDYKKNENFKGNILFCGIWTIGEYCGPSWKLESVD